MKAPDQASSAVPSSLQPVLQELQRLELTYTLYQPGRVTRRSSIWHRSPSGWQVIYHQGTVVQGAPS